LHELTINEYGVNYYSGRDINNILHELTINEYGVNYYSGRDINIIVKNFTNLNLQTSFISNFLYLKTLFLFFQPQ